MGGVLLGRVVAVVATLADGREQWGTGFLISDALVLTAAHCCYDKVAPKSELQRLTIIRASTGETADLDLATVASDRGVDLAVVEVVAPPWSEGYRVPPLAVVDRSRTGVLHDCQGVGYPLFQRDPPVVPGGRGYRNTSEFHGRIYQTDQHEEGQLLMREPVITPGAAPSASAEADGGLAGWPWGGLSGAAVFHRDRLIGVVTEHHPEQGQAAVRLAGFEMVVSRPAAAGIRARLGLSDGATLPVVESESVNGPVDVVDPLPQGGRLLIVEDQLLEELTRILSIEHVVLGVASWTGWIGLCDRHELDDVRGAIIDRHLQPLESGLQGDGLGLEIARHLRDHHAQIRPVLLSVDVGNLSRQSENLIEEYRLQEVVRKERGGRLDVHAILEAARSVMRPTAEDNKVWIKRCLATAIRLTEEFHSGNGAAGRETVLSCHREAEAISELLTRGELRQAAEELQGFQHRWPTVPRPAGARC